MSQRACDVRVLAPGKATAAALRSFSRAPCSTITRMSIVSPPSGVAAAGTRCTVSGTVQRAWMPPRHWMRGKRLPDATSQVSLVDYQQIRVGHPRSALARHLVAAGQQHLRMHQRFSAGQLRRTHPSTSVAAGSAVNDCSTVGRPSRTASASRAITCRSAPTSGRTGVGDLAE
jgi:hypothetical protein